MVTESGSTIPDPQKMGTAEKTAFKTAADLLETSAVFLFSIFNPQSSIAIFYKTNLFLVSLTATRKMAAMKARSQTRSMAV